MVRLSWMLSLVLFMGGCSTAVQRVDHLPRNGGSQQQHLAVFLDGTANDERSQTNVMKLFNLVTLQNRNDISATYVAGVGTGIRVLGGASGWGIGDDVRQAYRFLLDHHHQQDKIYLFGFSRGAHASRILASLLYVAGLPDVSRLSTLKRDELVEDIYGAFKDGLYLGEQPRSLAEKRKAVSAIAPLPGLGEPVIVEFMGIWDTVEALGWQDYRENINEPNERYSDQVCNLRYVAHALSLDDNRARVFTPLLMTRKHLQDESCDHKILRPDPARMDEVWFNGAHSDVGGGYSDTAIDGVSLNWMLAMLDKHAAELVPIGTRVYADYLGDTHDPEAGAWGAIYAERRRNLPCYVATTDNQEGCFTDDYDGQYAQESTSLTRPIKIHRSVFDRMVKRPPEKHQSDWFRKPPFTKWLLTASNLGGSIGNNRSAVGAMGCGKQGRSGEGGLVKVVCEDDYAPRQVEPDEHYCNLEVCTDLKQNPPDGLDCSRGSCCGLISYRGCRLENAEIMARERLYPVVLGEGSQKAVRTFFPDVKYDRTGVYLKEGQSYRFALNKVSEWRDAKHKATPCRGRDVWPPVEGVEDVMHGIVSKLVQLSAHSVNSGYMELIGKVVDETPPTAYRNKPSHQKPSSVKWQPRQREQLIKIGQLAEVDGECGGPITPATRLFTPAFDGELVLLVNEPQIPWSLYETYYDNNFGRVEVTIELLPESAKREF